MQQGLLNAATVLALQAPFLYALGLHFDVLRRHNFALGAAHALALSVMVNGYAAMGPIAAAGAAVVAAAALLLAGEALLFRPLERRGRTPDQILIASLGLNIVCEEALSASFGDAIRFPSGGDGLGGLLLALPPLQLAAPLSVLTVGGLLLVLTRSEPGARLVALGENPSLFAVLKLGPATWRYAAVALSGGVVAIGAVEAATVTGAYPTAGFPLVILGFATRLLGGPVHTPRFAVAAVGVVGFDQAVAAALPGEWRTPLLFAALLVLLSIGGLRRREAR